MKRVPRLDFMVRSPRPWAGLALSAVAAMLLAFAAAGYWRQERSAQQETARLNERTARLMPAPRKLNQVERTRLLQAARIADELHAPWADLLSTFEQHSQADIGLLKLEPDAHAALVRVTGEARDVRSLFGYLKALEGDPRLQDVALTRHQIEREAPGQPLRFTIQAGWRAGAVARKDVL